MEKTVRTATPATNSDCAAFGVAIGHGRQGVLNHLGARAASERCPTPSHTTSPTLGGCGSSGSSPRPAALWPFVAAFRSTSCVDLGRGPGLMARAWDRRLLLSALAVFLDPSPARPPVLEPSGRTALAPACLDPSLKRSERFGAAGPSSCRFPMENAKRTGAARGPLIPLVAIPEQPGTAPGQD